MAGGVGMWGRQIEPATAGVASTKVTSGGDTCQERVSCGWGVYNSVGSTTTSAPSPASPWTGTGAVRSTVGQISTLSLSSPWGDGADSQYPGVESKLLKVVNDLSLSLSNHTHTHTHRPQTVGSAS